MFNKNELHKLYRYALSLAKQEDMAYDLLQSSLERYLMKSRRTVDSPQAYLKVVIRNLFFDISRHNNVVPMISIESDEASYIEPVDDNAMDDLLMNQQEVQQLTRLLTAEENELLYLWAVEEYTTAEIANIYQQPRGTVLSRLHRLKKRIRKHAHIINMTEVSNE